MNFLFVVPRRTPTNIWRPAPAPRRPSGPPSVWSPPDWPPSRPHEAAGSKKHACRNTMETDIYFRAVLLLRLSKWPAWPAFPPPAPRRPPPPSPSSPPSQSFGQPCSSPLSRSGCNPRGNPKFLLVKKSMLKIIVHAHFFFVFVPSSSQMYPLLSKRTDSGEAKGNAAVFSPELSRRMEK